MRGLLFFLLTLLCLSASAQGPLGVWHSAEEDYAASQLKALLEQGGCAVDDRSDVPVVYVGLPDNLRGEYKVLTDSLREDGFFIAGDGGKVVLYGKGGKGTLYAVYAFLELLGYRLYTPDAMVVPDVSALRLPVCRVVSNPAFDYREVPYYYPNHSRLYADWHRLHTQADRNSLFGMYVHTFGKLLPPSEHFDDHPEWYSLNGGRRMRDGQLCLSNPGVLDALCQSLADAMARRPEASIWSVSPNDNYNACECDDCRRLDSLYGGRAGTLIWFVNQVAGRFPDKTLSTLAYQYTRAAGNVRPAPNVQVMLCPIESGRQVPITQSDKAFCKDIADWHRLTDNIYLWDYVVQFRNFWDPFPNLHVLQPNLQFFKENGVRMVFEQATGADNVTSWMDIRCYMIAKLLWDPYVDIDSVMNDFYLNYYGVQGLRVKGIVDTMAYAVSHGGRHLNIYGYPLDGAGTYLTPERRGFYWSELNDIRRAGVDSAQDERLLFFIAALEFAELELAAYDDTSDNEALLARADRLNDLMQRFRVPYMMEMGVTPDEYDAIMRHYIGKRGSPQRQCSLRRAATAPYDAAGLADGKAGIMDYRHSWAGFWGDTLDATVTLGDSAVVHSVSVDFYFYPLSWIFQPKWVTAQVSDDGVHWSTLDTLRGENPEVLATPSIHTYTLLPQQPLTARYLRVVAAPLDEIPAWHRAAGQKAWIFADEIIVR